MNHIRAFKKLQRQLQRKRHIKIELNVGLGARRLFHAGQVYKIGVLSLNIVVDWKIFKKSWGVGSSVLFLLLGQFFVSKETVSVGK